MRPVNILSTSHFLLLSLFGHKLSMQTLLKPEDAT